MASRDFEILEHPADIGFRAFGDTLPELFARAAVAMLSIAGDPLAAEPRERYPLHVESGDRGSRGTGAEGGPAASNGRRQGIRLFRIGIHDKVVLNSFMGRQPRPNHVSQNAAQERLC